MQLDCKIPVTWLTWSNTAISARSLSFLCFVEFFFSWSFGNSEPRWKERASAMPQSGLRRTCCFGSICTTGLETESLMRKSFATFWSTSVSLADSLDNVSSSWPRLAILSSFCCTKMAQYTQMNFQILTGTNVVSSIIIHAEYKETYFYAYCAFAHKT